MEPTYMHLHEGPIYIFKEIVNLSQILTDQELFLFQLHNLEA